MNNIAISPYIALHALQIQNIKRNVAKKIDVTNEIPDKNTDETPDKIVEQNNPTEEIKS
jgi:hypothetical protein